MSFIKVFCLLISLCWNSLIFAQPKVVRHVVEGCVSRPENASVANKHFTIDLSSSNDVGVWKSADTSVDKDKIITFQSYVQTKSNPRKYIVLYRIDPRFSRPEVIIQRYDYDKRIYKLDCVDCVTKKNTRQVYNDYIHFVNRSKIQVNQGEIINIKLITGVTDPTTFTTGSIANEIDTLDPMILNTWSTIENKIIYTSATNLCKALPNRQKSCPQDNIYRDPEVPIRGILGTINPILLERLNLTSCPLTSQFSQDQQLCFYDLGRGMIIVLNGKIIKSIQEPFIKYNPNGVSWYFFHHQAQSSGALDFTTTLDIAGMFPNLGDYQFMKNWDSDNFINSANLGMNFLHFGRYAMIVEISNQSQFNNTSDVKIEYKVSNTTPSNTESGKVIDQYLKTNPDNSGNLWFRVTMSEEQKKYLVNAKASIDYQYYTGSHFLSNLIFNKIVKPITTKILSFGQQTYSALSSDSALIRISKLMLTLYIILYALFFLAGAIQISTQDLVIRIIKIGIVTALFSPNSWKFFNENLFELFTKGADYLVLNSTGTVSSSSTNIFGFIDPIFDMYTNINVWILLIAQLFQIQNGMCFFAVLTIYAIILYCSVLLEVIIGYIMAFIGITIMISLAPIFITFILFERTKGMFESWLSNLFGYAIQPTIVLIFILIINQIMNAQLPKVLLEACIGYVTLVLTLDISHVPFLDNVILRIPFLIYPFIKTKIAQVTNPGDLFNSSYTYLSAITAGLLIYILSHLSRRTISYANTLVSKITSASSLGGATASVVKDIESVTSKPVTKKLTKAWKNVKRKI